MTPKVRQSEKRLDHKYGRNGTTKEPMVVGHSKKRKALF